MGRHLNRAIEHFGTDTRGMLEGGRHALLHTRSLEFDELRPYVPGDDVRDIDEQLISDHLYTAGLPDPDLLIRTAGELRVSNFLLWQISYAEIVIFKKCWPDFHQADLFEAAQEYARRHRRFGAL